MSRGAHCARRQESPGHPEVHGDPAANVFLEVDLAKAPAGFPKAGGGIEVPLYADLKRHDMGPELAESFGHPLDAQFTTARLWGGADTAPYLHDGRATTLFDAIEFHGGEAQDGRDAFMALAAENQLALIGFLKKLRTPEKPNEELVE